MFLELQNKEKIEYYKKMLAAVGSLSRLFSESDNPFIQYRVAENLFCKAFDAENLSRTDCSADASRDKIGFGIKTFLENNSATMQKVAEFNGEHISFKNLEGEEKIKKVSELRNDRIETTKRIFGLEGMIYHCVTRKKNKIIVYEIPMDLVDIENISNVVVNKNIISFKDGINEYSFNVTKSTLYKRFITSEPLLDFNVDILDDPFDSLEKFLHGEEESILNHGEPVEGEHIFLPLYSVSGGEKMVKEKSGLNQWNAAGRQRDPNEVYIQIPAWIHKTYPGFFPARDTAFTLILPNGKEMIAKVCQDGSKALMSKHNADLGQWLLRDVLDLKERELLTYDKLQGIGLDSVVIYKNNDGRYDIDFTKLGSYESFKSGGSGSSEEEEDDDIEN
jgi:hypothetical protein